MQVEMAVAENHTSVKAQNSFVTLCVKHAHSSECQILLNKHNNKK